MISLSICLANAQDIIVKHSGEELEAVITEILDESVQYKLFREKSGKVYSIDKSEIFYVKYKNGEKEKFAAEVRKADAKALPYPYPRTTRRYRVGDLFDEDGVKGVVFYTQDSGQHGLILSLQVAEVAWSSYQAYDVSWEFITHSDDENDGWANMCTIERCVNQTALTWDNFPAFKWCREQGTGWYYPSINELQKLYDCFSHWQPNAPRKAFNDLLKGAGAKKIYEDIYLSSSESDKEWVYGINFFRHGAVSTRYTKGSARVRAVHRF